MTIVKTKTPASLWTKRWIRKHSFHQFHLKIYHETKVTQVETHQVWAIHLLNKKVCHMKWKLKTEGLRPKPLSRPPSSSRGKHKMMLTKSPNMFSQTMHYNKALYNFWNQNAILTGNIPSYKGLRTGNPQACQPAQKIKSKGTLESLPPLGYRSPTPGWRSTDAFPTSCTHHSLSTPRFSYSPLLVSQKADRRGSPVAE